jgi:hypothetical protein
VERFAHFSCPSALSAYHGARTPKKVAPVFFEGEKSSGAAAQTGAALFPHSVRRDILMASGGRGVFENRRACGASNKRA